MAEDIFHRHAYAAEIAKDLLKPSALKAHFRSGVFLSGIRRIGKTTFLRADLIPCIQELGALPIYVDLWSNKQRSPISLLIEVVQRTVQELQTPGSWIGSKLRRIGHIEVGLAAFKFGIKWDSINAQGGPDIGDIFAELVRQARTDVVLIVDEVQQAVSTEDGMNLLHALKATRDRINTDPAMPGKFIFVGTGSHQALVSDMTTRRNQPFAGASFLPFRVLDDDFVRWMLDQVKNTEPRAVLPAPQVAIECFSVMGNRPEELHKALVELQRQVASGTTIPVDPLFRSICSTLAASAASVEIAAIESLGRLACVIYSRIAGGATTGHFGTDALERYAAATGVSVDASQVQNTAEKLIAANLILRTDHGRYAAADPFVASAWLAHERWQAADWLLRLEPAAPGDTPP